MRLTKLVVDASRCTNKRNYALTANPSANNKRRILEFIRLLQFISLSINAIESYIW